MLHKLSFKRKVIMYLHKKLRKVRLKKINQEKKQRNSGNSVKMMLLYS